MTRVFNGVPQDEVVLEIPAGAIATSGTITVSIRPTPNVKPDAKDRPIGFAYDFEARDADGNKIESFVREVTIYVSYDPDLLATTGYSEESVTPKYFSSTTGSWENYSNVIRDTANSRFIIKTDHFTYYVIVGGDVPDTPSDLTAITQSSSKISLSWTDNSDSETGFKIYRNSVNANWESATLVNTTSANATSWDNSGLTPNTTYYFRIKAFNNDGDSSWSNVAYATTAESISGGGPSVLPTMPVTTTGEVTATAAAGGKTTLTTTEGAKATVELPEEAVTADTIVEVVSVTKETVLTAAPMPVGKSLVSAFDLSATSGGVSVSTFAKTLTLTFTYTDEQIEGLDETTLKIYYWDGSQWVTLTSVVNTATNTITATTSHFTYFAIIGEPVVEEEIPVEEEVPAELTIEELKAQIAELLKQIDALEAQIQQIKLAELIPADYKFEKNLKYGQKSTDVRYLQEFLKAQGVGVYPEGLVTGYFGSLTKAAVIRFQEKYASDILTPWNLTTGTGLVGKTTRAKINEILGR